MKKWKKRLLAGLLAAVLAAMNTGNAVAAAEISNGVSMPAVQEKTLTVTADMLDTDGSLTLNGGSWDRIVFPKETGAKKVRLNGVTAKELIVESGTDGLFEIAGGSIGKCTVAAVPERAFDLTGFLLGCRSEGKNNKETKKDYEGIKSEHSRLDTSQPAFLIIAEAEIGSVELSGSAKFDFQSGKTAEITVNGETATGNLNLDITNFNGSLKVTQEKTGGAQSINLNLTASKVEKLEVEGGQSGSFVLDGADSSVTEAVVSSKAHMVLNVDTEKLNVTETGNNTRLDILTDVREVSIDAANSNIFVGTGATVEKAVILANNVTINGKGSVGSAQVVEGAKANVNTKGTKVEENVTRPVPTNPPAPTSAAAVTAAPAPTTTATVTAVPVPTATTTVTAAPAPTTTVTVTAAPAPTSAPGYPGTPGYPNVIPSTVPSTAPSSSPELTPSSTPTVSGVPTAVPSDIPTSGTDTPAQPETDAAFFLWKKNTDGTGIIITGYREELPADVIIPKEIEGLPVTGIADAYDEKGNLTGAFFGCSSLRSITIPDGVITIGESAFSCCDNLTTVRLPEGLKGIGDSVFSFCDNLTDIVLPDSLETIDSYAFAGCKKLETIILPDSLKTIGESAFSGCSSLAAIELPESVAAIGDYAFAWCVSLTDIKVPSKETLLPSGSNVFGGHNTELAIHTVKGSDAERYGKENGITVKYLDDESPAVPTPVPGNTPTPEPSGTPTPGASTTPTPGASSTPTPGASSTPTPGASNTPTPGVSSTPTPGASSTPTPGASSTPTPTPGSEGNPTLEVTEGGNTYFLEVIGPDNQVKITGATVSGTTLDIPTLLVSNAQQYLVVEIGEKAFYGTNLEYVKIGEGITTIGAGAFATSSALRHVEIDSSVTSIAPDAFAGNRSAGVSGSALVMEVEKNSAALEYVRTYGEKYGIVAKVPYDVNVPETYLYFYRVSDPADGWGVQLARGVDKSEIVEIVIPNEYKGLPVVKIGLEKEPPFELCQGAFSGCGFLEKVTLPDGLISIGDFAFFNCYELTDGLKLPDGLTTIGSGAFTCCYKLASELKLPDSLTAIGTWAFQDCSSLTGDLILPEGLTSINSYSFYHCSGLTGNGLVIPNGVTSVSNYAFEGCTGLKGPLILPDSLKSIGWGAFKDCSGLTGSLILPNSVEDISIAAFYGCSGFTGNLILPKSLTSISQSTFRGCSGLTGNLILPEGLTSIDAGAFTGCSNLTGSLILPKGLTSIGTGAFENCSKLTGDLILPEGLTSIDWWAFRGCSGLTGSLTLPEGLTSVERQVFYGCSGLTDSLTLPKGLKNIKESAFYGCSGLTKLILPDSLVSIDATAFYGCKYIKEIHVTAGSYAETWAKDNGFESLLVYDN